MGAGPGDEFLVICRRDGSVLLAKPGQMLAALEGSGKALYGDTDEYLRKERSSWE